MDKSQIESTINEIRKRSGAITAFMFVLFLISSSIIPTFVFAVEEQLLEEKEEKSWLETRIENEINHFSIFHILEGIGIAIIIPFIYLRMQKYSKRKTLIKIWKLNLEKINGIEKNSVSNMNSVLTTISFELNKIENQVADAFNMKDYLSYATQMTTLNQLLSGTLDKTPVKHWLENELKELVSTNKFPFYNMFTRA